MGKTSLFLFEGGESVVVRDIPIFHLDGLGDGLESLKVRFDCFVLSLADGIEGLHAFVHG